MEPSGLKILMISSDRNILTKGSAVSNRMKEYGKLVDELHIVLLSDSTHRLEHIALDANIWVYPTNSATSFLRPLDARRIGEKVVIEKKFVRGRSIITADSIECGWAGRKIKNRFRLPLEVQLHTDPFSPYFTGFQNTVRKFFAREVLTSADSIRVVGESVGKEIAKRFPQKKVGIIVLPIYIDRDRIEHGQIHFDLHVRFGWHFIVLAVGRLTVEKNFGLALEVLKRIVEFSPDTGLVIVGSGPEEEYLKTKAEKMGIGSHIAFVGWQEDLFSYYRTANLFLQTSRFEGYGLALVEAGLAGLPIVSTSVGIANDFVNGQDLYVCPQNDPEYMFKAVYDLIMNNQKREGLKASMKHALELKLISKEAYLLKLKEVWQKTASNIQL